MRGGFAVFWILMAVLEIVRRFNPVVIGWLGGLGPWLVLIMTVLPLWEMVREVRGRRAVQGIRTAIWTVLGIVTLFVGPAWLRF